MNIGDIKLENKVSLAPMAGITDVTFRTICKEMGVGLLYTEMVSCKGLFYNDKKTEDLMVIDENEHPTALQIFGSDPEIMSKVVYDKLNRRDDIDIIDINMGCPTPKIVKNGDGSALMKEPKLVMKILNSVVKVSIKPITIKIRLGWDYDNLNAVEIAKIAEQEGVKAIAVHGRTREQFYSGRANWDMIRLVKENVTIPVIGNGDILSPENGKNMLEETGCDGIMIGRGSRGNPWIFKRTLALINNGIDLPLPTPEEQVLMAIKHLNMATEGKREIIAVKEMRKHIAWYIKGLKYSAEMRNKINKINQKEELEEALEEYLERFKRED